MIVNVKVKPKAKLNLVKKEAEDLFHVYTTTSPEHGRANKAVLEALADYFKVNKNKVSILMGAKSRHKVIKISSD